MRTCVRVAMVAVTLLRFESVVHAQEAPPAAAPSPAAPADVEARERFAKGVQFYKAEDYKLALIEFERVYELTPNYKVLYNIGQVNFQLNNYARALKALDQYLREGGNEVPEDRRKAVEADIATLRDRVATIEVTANVPDAEILVDDVPAGKTPMKEPALVDAGQHVIRVSATGYQAGSKVVTLAGRDKTKISIELKKAEASVIIVEDKRNNVPTILAWTATGVFVVVGTVTGILSLNSQSTLSNLKESNQFVAQTDLDSVSSRAKTYAIVADVSFGLAIASAVVATYFTLKGDPKPLATPAAAIPPPRPVVRFAGSGLAGSF